MGTIIQAVVTNGFPSGFLLCVSSFSFLKKISSIDRLKKERSVWPSASPRPERDRLDPPRLTPPAEAAPAPGKGDHRAVPQVTVIRRPESMEVRWA